MWRIYYFNKTMDTVFMEDTLRSKRSAHSLAIMRVKERGFYTYAIGKLS